MMSLSHLIFPSKGLDNDQSFEPGQQKPGSMENLKNNFPAISTFKNYIPSLDMIKSLFIEKYNEATWTNVHTFLLNSGKSFNKPEFFMALQFIICVYFPGMALGIVYQYYELDQQTQQLIQKQQDQEEDIYQVILQEMQQQQPQQSRAYIKQQLEEQQSLQAMTMTPQQGVVSQSTPMMQFVQFIQRVIEQVIQTPQSMLYQIQYEQDCQYIHNQTIQQMQQQNNHQCCQYYQDQYSQYQYSQYQQSQEMQREQIQFIQKQGMSGCGMEQGMNYQQCIVNQLRYQGQQFIIVTIKQQVYPSTTTNSTQNNNENGGVNMITMVIKIKLPGEGHQIVQF